MSFFRLFAALAMVIGIATVAGGASAAALPESGSAATPSQGGTLNVAAVAGQWPGLDPATDALDAADSAYLNAIYGELFEVGPGNKIIPVEAKGYKFSDQNRMVTITLRPGMKFSDGTPFDAQAVASDITRDLTPSYACLCDENFSALQSVTATNATTVVLHLKRPFTGIISAFPGEAPNWTYSPTALRKEGEATFAQKPVGAGPFKVTSNSASARLELARNPTYFAKGKPYLSKIIITSVGTDESAYSSLVTKESQVVLAASSIPVIETAKSNRSVQVVAPPAQLFEFEALNETTPPFNNKLAREALYYATDTKLLIDKLYKGLYTPTESPDGPGQNYFEAKVPGYPAYNLKKAQALVHQLGGLSFKLMTTTNTQFWENEVEALQEQWQKAGMKVTIDLTSLQQMVSDTENNNWQVIDSNWGGYLDPGLALPIFFGTKGTFSGVRDPTIDDLISRAESTSNAAAQEKDYDTLYRRMATQYDAPILYAKPTFTFLTKGVQGITSKQPAIDWANVWLGG